MARNEQLIRQHKLLQLLELSRFGRTLDEFRSDLVADLGLSTLHTRTVRRDIEALQSAGFDIRSESLERGKVYRLGDKTAGVHEIGISASEMIALAIGRELLYPLVGTQYWKGIETFWNKVQELVPDGVYDHFSRYREHMFVFGSPHKSYEQQEGILRTLNRAINEHRVCEVEYAAVDKPATKRTIEPYGVAFYQSSIYIVAAASEVKESSERMRHWKLDRFRSAIALDEYFKPDPNVDLSRRLGSTIGIFSGQSSTEVQIQLSSRAVAWVGEDPWHPDQELVPNEQGAVLKVPAAHERELLPKVLSLGGEAEVLAPIAFREAVAEAVGRMSSRYEAVSTGV
ncbi:MAG: WYL domain-containing transcriptional regulator [Planctomycetota bacterium]